MRLFPIRSALNVRATLAVVFAIAPVASSAAAAAEAPAAVAAAATAADPSASLAKLFSDYYAAYRELYPIDTLELGDNSHASSGEWQDGVSPAWRARVDALCTKYLAALERVDRATLSAADRTSHDVLRWLLRSRQEGLRTFLHYLPARQLGSPHLLFAQMASGEYLHPFRSRRDFEMFQERARGFSRWVDEAKAAMHEGSKRGIVQPRVLVERMIAQLEPLASADAEKNILFRPLQHLPANLSPSEQAMLRAEYRTVVEVLMLPAYRNLLAFLKQEYLAQACDTHGLGALPGGAEVYAYLVRQQTTTDLTPEAVHALGLSEVARLRGELDAVRREVKFDGGLRAFLDHVQTDPRFAPYRDAETVLADYRAIESRVMASVPKLFKRVPRSKFEIRQTEAFRAASASAEYVPGTADGSRPGVFYIPIPDPSAIRTPTMEALFLHEAIPGHHFDMSLGVEDTALPAFRRYEFINAYTEGWGLYAESLAQELGLARDPYAHFGQLYFEMWRAVRLVVDTGIHAQGWTREKAMEYSAEQLGGAPIVQAGAIERYMAWPGQALSYKVGQLKIRELRRRAEAALGEKFDAREFHDQVIGLGAMPLAVLEQRVDDWLRAAR